MASESPAVHEASSSDDDDFEEIENAIDENWTVIEIEEFQKEVQNTEKKMSILCCGPTGAGKSTLLNSLMGENLWSVDENREGFHVEDSLSRVTLNVSEKMFERNGVQVTVWDTPGLEGCENDEAYLKEIKSKCENFDLFLYCINGSETRATDLFDEKSTLVKFTQLFGVKLWKYTVVVLTQANAIEADFIEEKQIDDSIDIEVNEMFQHRVNEWKERVRKELAKLGVDKKVPVLPAGINNIPLAGDPNWLQNIFLKMTKRMKYNSRIAYLQLSIDQPFAMSLKEKVSTGALSTGAGVASGVTGATIGATIGALLIGIPSFGAFAGVGLILGGALGGGVGVGSAAVVAKAFSYFKKRKHRKKKERMKRILETQTTAK